MNKAQQLSTVLVLCAGVTPLAAEDYEMRLCKRVEVKPGQFRMVESIEKWKPAETAVIVTHSNTMRAFMCCPWAAAAMQRRGRYLTGKDTY